MIGLDHLLLGHAGETAADLCLEDLFGLAGFAFGESFTHANNGLERRGMGCLRLFGDQLVRFLLVLAALGVAEDDVANGKFLEHHGAISPVYAPTLCSLMFCAPRRMFESRMALETSLSAVNGGQTTMSTSLIFVSSILRSRDEVQRLGDRLVHLPIAGDDQFAFFVHSFNKLIYNH